MGRGDPLVYDGFRESDTLALPHIISFCYALTAALIKRFVDIAERTQQIEKEAIDQIWREALEEETVPRRFGTGLGQIFRGPQMEIILDDEENR